MGSCLLSVGHFGERRPAPLCPPPAAASMIAPGHNTQAGDDHNLRPKPVPAARSTSDEAAPSIRVWPFWGG
eukprot:scaffold1532_cov39-Phaeocystis_antarctica.AAC.1